MRAAEIKLSPAEGAFPGIDRAFAVASDVRRERLLNLEWLSDGSYALLYRLLAREVERVVELLADHPEVRSFDVVPAGETGGDGGPEAAGVETDAWRSCHVFCHVDERAELSALLGIASDHALLLERPFRIAGDGVVVTVAGEGEALQSAYREVADTVPVEVLWTGEYVPERAGPLGSLTDRQREALAVAHRLGFYETPREVSYEDIAAELDCAPSTANELLRRAERALIESVLAR